MPIIYRVSETGAPLVEFLYHGGGGGGVVVANRLIGFYPFYPPINRFSDFGKIEPA